MRENKLAILVLLLLAWIAALATVADPGCVHDGGAWYCQETYAITYHNIATSEAYDRVIDANGCQTKPLDYEGPLAPFDEEVCQTSLSLIEKISRLSEAFSPEESH